jgi:hypothetical protein
MANHHHHIATPMENTADFDLNRAIADWRHQLGQSPAYRADDLEEMESHLRDALEQLRTAGLTEEEAFLVATRRVGAPRVLEAEFAKINGRSVWLDRLLWMLVGVQAWMLTGALASTFSWLTGWFVFTYFQGSGWLPRKLDGSILSIPMLLVSVINLLAIAAFCVLCWRYARRIGPRLPELLRQPGWLVRRLVVLCVAILLANMFLRLAHSLTARFVDPQTYGNLAFSSAMADLVLFVVKTVGFTWLSVVLIRRRLRLTPAI